MATTPNFGWQTPNDTDYVKDGASAIRTLGNAIDASMADLEGGTTGQVLSKNSNTDMDFVWITPNDADAIQNTIVDAKGDLITATAADTPARLAVGTNGQVLTADSTTATGLKWGAAAGGLTFVTEASFTTQSTVNVNNCFTSTYDNYLLVIDVNTPSVTSLLMNFRLRVSGTDASGANYARSYIANTYNNATVVAGSGSTETEWWGLGMGSTGSTMCNIVMDLRKPALATRTFMNARYTKADVASSDTGVLGGFHSVNTAYDGFTLFTSTGTVSGSYKVYGYQNN